jgi:hypothetical protein
VQKEPPGFRALTAFVSRFRVPLLVLGVLGGVAGGDRAAADRLQLALLRLPAASTESAQALTLLEADPLMSPVYANVSAPDVETARAMASQLRALPEVGGVQTATDLLPVLDAPRLAALRSGLAALAGAGLRQAGGAADHAGAAGAEGQGDRRRARRGPLRDGAGRAADRRHRRRRSRRSRRSSVRLGALDEAGKARLADIEPKLAGLLGRAVTTARAVASAAATCRSDLPPLFRERFRGPRRLGMALYVIPSGSALRRRRRRPSTRRCGGRPGRLGAGGQHQPARDDDHHRLSQGGRAVGGADLPVVVVQLRSCGTRRWPWSRRRSAGCGCSG